MSFLTLNKCLTGIEGLDQITNGGLPECRTTMVAGPTGCGKTLLSMSFLVNGAKDHQEPGIFVSFDESSDDIKTNFSSMHLGIEGLEKDNQLLIKYYDLNLQDIVIQSDKDFEAFFAELEADVTRLNAKRVVLDSLDSILGISHNRTVMRKQLLYLYQHLREMGLTAIITCEGDREHLSLRSVEEYISDCVIFLDHRVNEHVSTRRLKIVKYRGSAHETNEFPFMINQQGLTLLPITSAALDYQVSKNRLSSGLAGLDEMLEGKGFFQGSSILFTGTAGTGKSTLAALAAKKTCETGEKALYFSFEEPSGQIIRNQQSVGLDLQSWVDAGLLQIQSTRPTMFGIENHLLKMQAAVNDFQPKLVVIDPVTNFMSTSDIYTSKVLLIRMIDYLKNKQITAIMTSLTSSTSPANYSEADISSLIDTWLVLRDQRLGNRRMKTLTILKSRGMAHDDETRHLVFSNEGIKLQPLPEKA